MRLNRFAGLFLVALSVAAFAFAQPPEGRRGPGPGGPPDGRPGGEAERGGPRGEHHHGRPPMGPPAIIKAIDANNDQKISAEEIENAAAALKKLDKNGDGELTPNEFAFPGHGGPPHGRDGHGRDEHHRRPRDGQPPRDGERPRREGERPPRDGKPGERGQGHHGPRPPHGPGSFGERFKEIDKNGDDKISREEAIARVNEMFDKVDANGDDQIEKSEMREFMSKMMQERRGHRHHGPARDGDRPPRGGNRPPRGGDGPPRDGERPPRDG